MRLLRGTKKPALPPMSKLVSPRSRASQQFVPATDRVVVHQQRSGDLTAPSTVQQHQRARRVTRDAAEPSRTNATSLPRSSSVRNPPRSCPEQIRQTEKHKEFLPSLDESAGMKIANALLIALLAGLSVATWTSQASAAGGDAAITRCITQAQRQFPTNRRYQMSNRTFSYKACMMPRASVRKHLS
jgi:hypothetical protein